MVVARSDRHSGPRRRRLGQSAYPSDSILAVIMGRSQPNATDESPELLEDQAPRHEAAARVHGEELEAGHRGVDRVVARWILSAEPREVFGGSLLQEQQAPRRLLFGAREVSLETEEQVTRLPPAIQHKREDAEGESRKTDEDRCQGDDRRTEYLIHGRHRGRSRGDDAVS